jgi:hypothetical protein
MAHIFRLPGFIRSGARFEIFRHKRFSFIQRYQSRCHKDFKGVCEGLIK